MRASSPNSSRESSMGKVLPYCTTLARMARSLPACRRDADAFMELRFQGLDEVEELEGEVSRASVLLELPDLFLVV